MSSLPPRIRELVGLVGIEAVMQLLDARLFGREWRVSGGHDSEFYRAWSDVIGEGLTDLIVKAWNGRDALYLANCAGLLRAERHRALIERFDALVAEGMTSRAAILTMCRETGISDRWLREVINRPTPPPSPEDQQMMLDLFSSSD
jgi:hypothetical protein